MALQHARRLAERLSVPYKCPGGYRIQLDWVWWKAKNITFFDFSGGMWGRTSDPALWGLDDHINRRLLHCKSSINYNLSLTWKTSFLIILELSEAPK
jgi:hypothetical protein